MKIRITETDGRPIGDIITPVSFTLTENELTAQVHPYFRENFDFAIGAEPIYPLANAFFERLTDTLSTKLETIGYEKEPLATSWGTLLHPQEAWKNSLKTDFSSTLSKETVDNYQNLLICDLKGLVLSGCLAAAVVEGGRILSGAVTHLPLSQIQEGLAEIAVETHPSVRGRGYAASCVATLTNELLSRGCSVLYRCRAGNAASLAVAKKAGFVQYAQYYRLVGRRESYGL